MIVKVAAHSWQWDCRLDANRAQLVRFSDPGSQKDRRRAIRSTRDDEPRCRDLAGSVGPGVVTLRDGMRTVLVADAVIESADKGESIAL